LPVAGNRRIRERLKVGRLSWELRELRVEGVGG